MKWICRKENNGCYDDCRSEVPGSCIPTQCLFSESRSPAWEEDLETEVRPTVNHPKQKLTKDVFNHPSCPAGVNIAVLNRDGKLFFGVRKSSGKVEPNMERGSWTVSGDAEWRGGCIGVFNPNEVDVSNWPEGCVVYREEELPELPAWCKVGEVVWGKEEQRFGRIVGHGKDYGTPKIQWLGQAACYHRSLKNLQPVVAEVWNYDTAPITLKILWKGEPAIAYLSSHNKCGFGYQVDANGRGEFVTMEQMMKNGVDQAGNPCCDLRIVGEE